MNEIIKYDPAKDYRRSGLAERQAYIYQIAQAGALLPKAATERTQTFDEIMARTFYIAEVGAMMGIHPLEALAGIHMIEGRWTASSALMSSLVRQAGHKLRVTESGSWKARDFVATCTIVRHDDPDYPTVMSFGYEDAEIAGLLGKGNWAKYGKSMCAARAISKCARAAAEDALGGARYTPEELGAAVNEEGEPVDLGHVESVPDPRPAPAPQAAPQAAPAPAPASAAAEPPATATAPTAARPAAQVTDEQIIAGLPTEVVQHSSSAWKAHAAADADELLGIWNSAKAARIMNNAALRFNELGQPALYGRDDQGAPVPLGAMLRTLGDEARRNAAESEAVAANAADEHGGPAVADEQGHPSVRTVEPQPEPETVEGELMGEDSGNDPETA